MRPEALVLVSGILMLLGCFQQMRISDLRSRLRVVASKSDLLRDRDRETTSQLESYKRLVEIYRGRVERALSVLRGDEADDADESDDDD